jgi:hypothetical protein
MNMLLWMMPCMLLAHNLVDFGENGAALPYVHALNAAVTEYVDRLETYNSPIRLINKTGHMDESGIENIGLQFEYSALPLDMDDARHLMLGLIDSFLQAINRFARLQPYLKHRPMTPEDIEIRIHFVGQGPYSYPAPYEIKYLSFKGGILNYYLGNPRCLGRLERLHDETLPFARAVDAQMVFPPGLTCDPSYFVSVITGLPPPINVDKRFGFLPPVIYVPPPVLKP